MSQSGQRTLARAMHVLELYREPLALVGAALTTAAETLLHPALIVPLIVVALVGTVTPVGVLAAMAVVAWALPQLFFDPTGWKGMPASWPGWLLAARAGVAAFMALILVLLGGTPATLLGGLLVLVGLFWLLGGLTASGRLANVLASPTTAQSIRMQRHHFWGGALAVLGGLFIARLLSPTGPAFPGWAVIIAGLVSLLLALAALAVWRGQPASDGVAGLLWPHLMLAPALLVHGRRLRRYVFFRLLLIVGALADPFYLIYAIRTLDLPLQSAGIYVALFALIRTATGLTYPSLIAAGYARAMTQLCALARLLMPLLALVLSLILSSEPLNRPDMYWLGPTAFAGIIVLLALATGGVEAADVAYLREALAPAQRPAMQALWLVLLGVLAIVFVIGGMMADRWGFQTLLLVTFGVGVVTVLASGLLLSVPPADTRDLTGSGALPTFRESGEW